MRPLDHVRMERIVHRSKSTACLLLKVVVKETMASRLEWVEQNHLHLFSVGSNISPLKNY